MDIDGWLGRIGLAQYAEMFRANDIDGELLGHLTNDDLKDIGVASFGHRKKLLEAIAELGGTPSATPAPIPATVAPPPTPASAEATGERRYLTVMFCDLVGSTGISAQLDAEEWRDLVGSYLDAASAAVTEMGGHVAKKLGDGLMSLFGYPAAHENDAERAARAALAIQRALADLNRKKEGTSEPVLAARIGLETGPAVVDAAGEIYGDVANVAARVQALAEPGAVLVTARVQRQVAGLFVAEDRGTHTLKGVPEPITLYKLVRASGGGRRSGQRNLTPLVGRDDEMAMLLRRWDRARQGDGQLVMIVGEPGLGKSRLIEEFHARLTDTPHTWVEWCCSQLLQNTPLHPIAEWGRQRFGGTDVPAERRLADLEGSLAQVKLDPAENASLLAPLLDIPLPKERAPALAPEELRRRQLAALTNWVMAGAKIQPVMLAFEDLHWADPTTLDVLRGIAERGALAPLLIVATTRPEFRPPWSMRSHHGTISLAPLDRAQVRDMVAELSARHALPKDVVDDVAARTGGVPLFVEEVTRLLLERGEQGGGIQAIPPTLQQSLTARLDRLGPAREVAQIGSVIGRSFSYALLRDVAGIGSTALQAALEKLVEADIVLVQGSPPESDYRFKHALIQDAAYENLLKSRRQILHRRVAEILLDRFAGTAAAEPEALAYHFTRAGMTDAAIEWWGKAGDQSLRRSAFQEAISHLGKAIEMADNSAGTSTVREAPAAASAGQRLKLQTTYGQALLWGRGHTLPETKAAFARAGELARQVENAADRFSAFYGQWVAGLTRGEIGLAREMAGLFLHEIEVQPNQPEACVSHRIFGTTCWYMGELTRAHDHLQLALNLFDRERHQDFMHRFGQDVASQGGIFDALALYGLGRVDEALQCAEQAGKAAEATAHVPSLAQLHYWRFLLGLVRGRAVSVLTDVNSLSRLVAEHDLRTFAGYVMFAKGWLKWRRDRETAGMTDMSEGIGYSRAQGIHMCLPMFEAALAEAEAETGKIDASLARLDRAHAEADQTGERWCQAELHRIRGEILLKRDSDDTASAVEAFLTAIAIAQQQQARSFELHAALSLAKLYQSTGGVANAHAVLAPALEGFLPSPEYPEIEEAQALLATLAKTDEVAHSAAQRQRRLQLQTAYGNALISARGYQAPETTAAFARARELAAGIEDASERFSVHYGQWAGCFVRAELAPMRELVRNLLDDCENRPVSPEAGVAHRLSGETNWFEGKFAEARADLERALAIFDSGRDRELAFRFGQDVAVTATAFLACVMWPLGDVDRARQFADEMVARALRDRHVPTIAWARVVHALFEVMCGNPARAAANVTEMVGVAREHGMKLWMAFGSFLEPWARSDASGRDARVEEMRRGIAILQEQGVSLYGPLLWTALARAETEVGEIDAALATVDRAIIETERTDQRWFESETHRIRGEILLKRDLANAAAAEDAFLAAIAIAQQQQARSFELHAALSLAKLYQSTGRAANAHAVLVPALEGFSPTSEFPEIAEAQRLLGSLGS